MGDNRKTTGFDLLMQLDDRIIAAYNFAIFLKFLFLGHRKKYKLERNQELKNIHKGQRCFIIANGPSIQNQDLTLLKDEWTFAVNHFWRHPQVQQINPKYWAIIDPKLTTGEWPLSMLDEIQEKCPQVKFFLSAHYHNSPQLLSKALQFNPYWVYPNQLMHEGFSCSSDLTGCLGGVSVTTICLLAAIYMGFKDIYLLGVDNDGIFRDLIDQSSHFYEGKKENIGDNDPKLVVRHLRTAIQGMRGWGVIANKFEGSSHRIVNLTKGGLLNDFPREDYEQVVLKGKSSLGAVAVS